MFRTEEKLEEISWKISRISALFGDKEFELWFAHVFSMAGFGLHRFKRLVGFKTITKGFGQEVIYNLNHQQFTLMIPG